MNQINDKFDVLVDEYIDALLKADPRLEELERQLLEQWPLDTKELLIAYRMADLLAAIAALEQATISDDHLKKIESRITASQ